MSKKPKVNVLPIEQGATPDPQNANKHTARGGALLENSLQRRGAFRSIASAGKGVDVPVVYAGNYTLEKAAAAGFKEIVNVHVTGDQLVNVVRDDIAPHTAEAIALGLEDNEIGKQSYSPDIDLVASLAAGDSAILSALKREDKVFGGILEGMGAAQTVKSLEELAAEYGGSEDDDFHPVIRIKVTTKIKERFDAVMVLMPGANEMEKIDALISRGELS